MLLGRVEEDLLRGVGHVLLLLLLLLRGEHRLLSLRLLMLVMGVHTMLELRSDMADSLYK